MDAVKIWGDKMTKDEARKELLETLEEYCHDKGYNLQVFAGMANWVYTLYPLQKKMTNGDLIRSMTDEQLAEWLDEHDDQEDFCNTRCPYYDDDFDCVNLAPNSCVEGRLEWLKQEHKENSNEL